MKKQTGFSLVSAIFVIVILALIGSYIIRLSALTNQSTSLSSLSVKAYYAAKSGLEWGAYSVAPLGIAGPYHCPAASTHLSLIQGGLSELSVTVTCTVNSFIEHGKTYNVFQLLSTGTYGVVDSADFASRQLYMTIVQPGI